LKRTLLNHAPGALDEGNEKLRMVNLYKKTGEDRTSLNQV
jgi:hypothetical protein